MKINTNYLFWKFGERFPASKYIGNEIDLQADSELLANISEKHMVEISQDINNSISPENIDEIELARLRYIVKSFSKLDTKSKNTVDAQFLEKEVIHLNNDLINLTKLKSSLEAEKAALQEALDQSNIARILLESEKADLGKNIENLTKLKSSFETNFSDVQESIADLTRAYEDRVKIQRDLEEWKVNKMLENKHSNNFIEKLVRTPRFMAVLLTVFMLDTAIVYLAKGWAKFFNPTDGLLLQTKWYFAMELGVHTLTSICLAFTIVWFSYNHIQKERFTNPNTASWLNRLILFIYVLCEWVSWASFSGNWLSPLVSSVILSFYLPISTVLIVHVGKGGSAKDSMLSFQKSIENIRLFAENLYKSFDENNLTKLKLQDEIHKLQENLLNETIDKGTRREA